MIWKHRGQAVSSASWPRHPVSRELGISTRTLGSEVTVCPLCSSRETNSHAGQVTHSKCTLRWWLVYSQRRTTINTISFRTFASPPKETLYSWEQSYFLAWVHRDVSQSVVLRPPTPDLLRRLSKMLIQSQSQPLEWASPGGSPSQESVF